LLDQNRHGAALLASILLLPKCLFQNRAAEPPILSVAALEIQGRREAAGSSWSRDFQCLARGQPLRTSGASRNSAFFAALRVLLHDEEHTDDIVVEAASRNENPIHFCVSL
jgi:hypothetical protein